MTILSLDKFLYPNLEIPSNVLHIAKQMCDNFINCQLDAKNTLQALFKAANDPKKSEKDQQLYWELVKISYACIENDDVHLVFQLDSIDKKKLELAIQGYIIGCEEEANEVQNIHRVLDDIANQSSIEINFLAIFYHLLTIHKELLSKLNHPNPMYQELCENLLNVLQPFVLPYPELEKIYNVSLVTLSMFNYDESCIGFCESSLETLIKCVQKINLRLERIKIIIEQDESMTEKEKLELLKNLGNMPTSLNDSLVMQNKFLAMSLSGSPIKCDCQTINLENYKGHPFNKYYEFASWYKQLTNKFYKFKALQQQKILEEVQKLQTEADEYIKLSQAITLKHKNDKQILRSQLNTTAVISKLEKDYQFSLTVEQLKSNLQSLNTGGLEILKQICEFHKDNKLTFLKVQQVILALGGRMQIFDGSKTRILFPGGHTTATLKVYGGLHKPHRDNEFLSYIHAKLIAKALKRAGINKEDIVNIMVEKLQPQQLTANNRVKRKIA